MTAIVDGWLEGAARVPTPNVDERPPDTSIELIVIHNISLPPGRYGGGYVHALFTNALDPDVHPFFATIAEARVSAHLLIERDGTATQFAPFDRRAWHAGASEFEGRSRCNDFSVGIELEGSDFEAFTEAQYATLNRAVAALCTGYPVRAVRGHSDIAAGRKTDPGPCFEWGRLVVPPSVSLPQLRG
jgi:AmpD protein